MQLFADTCCVLAIADVFSLLYEEGSYRLQVNHSIS